MPQSSIDGSRTNRQSSVNNRHLGTGGGEPSLGNGRAAANGLFHEPPQRLVVEPPAFTRRRLYFGDEEDDVVGDARDARTNLGVLPPLLSGLQVLHRRQPLDRLGFPVSPNDDG